MVAWTGVAAGTVKGSQTPKAESGTGQGMWVGCALGDDKRTQGCFQGFPLGTLGGGAGLGRE